MIPGPMTPSSTSPALNLPTPPDFPFPFAKPYDIQVDLMRTVFEAVEGRKIAIVRTHSRTAAIVADRELYLGRITNRHGQILESVDCHINLARAE